MATVIEEPLEQQDKIITPTQYKVRATNSQGRWTHNGLVEVLLSDCPSSKGVKIIRGDLRNDRENEEYVLGFTSRDSPRKDRRREVWLLSDRENVLGAYHLVKTNCPLFSIYEGEFLGLPENLESVVRKEIRDSNTWEENICDLIPVFSYIRDNQERMLREDYRFKFEEISS